MRIKNICLFICMTAKLCCLVVYTKCNSLFKMQYIRLILIVFGVFSFEFISIQKSYGQSSILMDTIMLPDVEVKANAVLLNESSFLRSLDTISLQSLQSSQLNDLLSQHSSVFVKNYGPGALSTVSLRGTAANHTLVLWNDMPINAPMLGQVDFSRIPVFFVDQVGVFWGSASSANRAGGLGGTVALNNTMALNKGFHLDLSQSLGSFGSIGTYANVDFSNQKMQFRTRVYRKSSTNDFEYENTAILPNARLKQQNADYLDYGFLQEIHLAGKWGNISFLSWNQWNDRNLPPIMTNLERGGNPEEYQDDRFHRNVLSHIYAWESGKIETKIAYFIENQQYFLRTTGTGNLQETVTLIDSKNKLESSFGQVKVTENIFKKMLVFGRIQWSQDKVVSNNYTDPKSRTQTTFSLGTQWDITKGLFTEIVLNQDFMDKESIGFHPPFTMNYAFPTKQELLISGSITSNYHLPSMNDLYWYPVGNINLRPENGIISDLAIQWKPPTGRFKTHTDVNLFFSVINDWIQWRPTAYRYWEPLNISHVFARGIEFHFETQTNISKVNISLSGNYMFTLTTDESQVAKLENISGRQLIYIPKHHGNLFLNLGYRKFLFTYTIEMTGKRTTSPDGEDLYTGVLPAYMLHNASISKNIGAFDLAFKVNNLYNKSYQAVMWRAMPGRNFEFLLRYKL